MRRFLWKGFGSRQHCGQALVSWDSVCRHIQVRELGILDLQKNTALLEKWVAKFMSSQKDLVTQVLKESYDKELN